MGKRNQHRDSEVFLTTYDGTQHLRLHSWLKKNDVVVRSETIVDEDDYFGVFTIIISNITLDKLKEENLDKGLYCDLETMGTESERWSLYKHPINKDTLKNIQDFIFSFQIKDKKDIERFLKQANETSLVLFKKDDDFINDYIETDEMTKDDKLKDIEIMIDAFCEEERYEDCALLVKIKEKVIKHYENIPTGKSLP